MRMKSCVYCHRIVPYNHICDKRPKPRKKYDDKMKFRGTGEWVKKREDIRIRDNNVCVLCLMEDVLTYENLSVHHIEPLEERYDLRLDDSNLITLCSHHHELAEGGKINRKLLHDAIKDK